MSTLERAKRVVVKNGSSLLTNQGAGLDRTAIADSDESMVLVPAGRPGSSWRVQVAGAAPIAIDAPSAGQLLHP